MVTPPELQTGFTRWLEGGLAGHWQPAELATPSLGGNGAFLVGQGNLQEGEDGITSHCLPDQQW